MHANSLSFIAICLHVISYIKLSTKSILPHLSNIHKGGLKPYQLCFLSSASRKAAELSVVHLSVFLSVCRIEGMGGGRGVYLINTSAAFFFLAWSFFGVT